METGEFYGVRGGERIIEVSCVHEDATSFLLPGIGIIYLCVITIATQVLFR